MRPRFRSIRAIAFICFAFAVAAIAVAQQPAKVPITHDAYDGWRSIQGTKLSRDGSWLVYGLTPQDGDGELVVRNLQTGAEHRQSRGRDAAITADGRFVVFAIAPPKAEVDKAKKDKKKPEEMPKPGLGVLTLATGAVFTADRVKSFKLAEDASRFVAFLLEPPEKKVEPGPEKKEAEQKAADAKDKKKEKKKDAGTDLILRDLASGSMVTLSEVVEYTWPKDGSFVAYAVSSAAKTPERDGVYLRRSSDGVTRAMLSGLGHYKGLAFDDKAVDLAFLSDRDDYKADAPAFKLYLWTSGNEAALEAASASTPGMKAGWAPSENGSLEFSKDGERLFFGTAAAPRAEPDSAPDPVKVDIWTWKDPLLQPMQKVRADEEKKRTYRAVLQLKDKRFVQLASEDLPELTVNDGPDVALGLSDVPYQQALSWDADHFDVYAVKLQDGSRRKLAEKSRFSATLSPGGGYVLTFDAGDTQWYAIRVSDGVKTNLTGKLGVRFDDESTDTPEPAPSYGTAGWSSADRSVLLYDKYDIWEIRPDGTGARMLTGGLGRKQGIVFRHVRTDPDETTIPVEKPILVFATNEKTKSTGYYRVTPTMALAAAQKPAAARGKTVVAPSTAPLPSGYGEPARLVMIDKLLSGPAGGGRGGASVLKPKNADAPLVVTEQRFDEFPDLWAGDSSFAGLKKVSDANPQQSRYIWGRSELVDFRNTDGKPLRAILTRPENFDPSKKYPLLVYIYEELTNLLHRYVPPAPGTSINITRYVSNGYIVLQPDIEYEIGYPGESAMRCVIPAVQRVVDMGFVDPARIGIQGHSWGGYQITYMITRTNLFRAVEAGASVSNMISAYGGIRWGSGMSRAFQYERSQSRIGGPPWSRSLQFIENSPIFWVEKVQTPYLSIHNDEDDAVPWYQGIEFFSAMRRLGKEAFMFNFNGEKHGLRERENQKYWTVYMTEFFDHYLLGAPRPEWMDKGVPYLDRGKRDISEIYKPKKADAKK